MSVRIDYGFCPRELFSLSVVVGHHELHAERIYVFGFGYRRYAVIYGDYERNSVLCNDIGSFCVKSVALRALGDIISYIRACFKQIGIKYHRCNYAVAVIIAVYAYALAVFNSAVYRICRFLHILYEKRVGKLVRIKAFHDRFCGRVALGGKCSRCKGAYAAVDHKSRNDFSVGNSDAPFFHTMTPDEKDIDINIISQMRPFYNTVPSKKPNCNLKSLPNKKQP